MEFIDISLLTGEKVDGSKKVTFEEMKAAPKVRVTADLQLVQDAENLAVLDAQLEAGYPMVSVSRDLPEKNYMDRPEFPRRVILEITTQCNLLCTMCARNDLRRPTSRVETETCLKVLDEINDYGVEGIWLYRLGESLLHPDFRKIVRHLDGLDNIGLVWMSTNGHLLNQANLEFVLDSRIDFLNYSLNAMTPEVYKGISSHGNFDLVQKNYRRLVEYKSNGYRYRRPFARAQLVEHEINKHEATDFINAHYSEVEVVSISMLDYVNLPANSYGLVQRQRSNRGHCKKVRRGDCFVCSNGMITPCDPSYNCDPQEAEPLLFGNIYDASLHDVWNGERRKKVLEMEEAGRLTEIALCRNCKDYDL